MFQSKVLHCFSKLKFIWDKVIKNGPSNICGRQTAFKKFEVIWSALSHLLPESFLKPNLSFIISYMPISMPKIGKSIPSSRTADQAILPFDWPKALRQSRNYFN